MRQAVILVGGKGTRLGGLTGGKPKPFLDIGGRPFIDLLINHAKCQGVSEVILLAGHAADWIKSSYKTTISDVRITISAEAEPMGTAGALLSAYAHLDETFLLLNGDSILTGNWTSLYPLLGDHVSVVLASRAVDNTGRYGRIASVDGSVTNFSEKSGEGPGNINAGVYAVRRDMLLPHITGPASLENDILPVLVANGSVRTKRLGGFFIDIGLPDTLSVARDTLHKKLRAPAVFFDRDNTLVEDRGYTHKVSDLKWIEGAVETIRRFNDIGHKVFIATNQSGIARGYYSVTDMDLFHAAMQRDLYAAGAHVDGYYHCPHHPDNTSCTCRKPASGLLEQVFEQHSLDHSQSIMVGDKASDTACGEAFGITSFLYEGGSLLKFCQGKGILQ